MTTALAPGQSPPVATTPDSLLVKDYELKIRYLTDHFSRMWTRFNYFVTIESALLGGKVAFGNGKWSLPLVLLGLFLSAVWYVMGAEDRYLVRLYRAHVRLAAERLAAAQWKEVSPYIFVGDVDGTEARVPMDVSGWRLEPISTTRLAALIPLAAFVAWGVAAFWAR